MTFDFNKLPLALAGGQKSQSNKALAKFLDNNFPLALAESNGSAKAKRMIVFSGLAKAACFAAHLSTS